MRYAIAMLAVFQAFASDAVLKRAAAYVIMRNEGFRSEPYVCANGRETVGYGHLVTSGAELRKYTREEAAELFYRDLDRKIVLARRLLPDFDSYPVQVGVAILDGCFRGDLSGSPKTLDLIRRGLWVEASEEYVDHEGYRKSKRLGTGVYKRMDRNAFVFRSYGQKIGGEP